MTQMAGSGGGGSRYRKWPKNTVWAHFKGVGWVRKGSARWKNLTVAIPGGRGGPGHQRSTPDKKMTSDWNPESPQFKTKYTNNYNPSGGKQGHTPGSKVGGTTSQPQGPYGGPANKHKGPGTNPGTNPGGPKVKPPKDPKKNTKPDKTAKANLALFGKMIGDPNVGKMLPRSMADAIAGLQFDAPIHDMQNQIGREPYQRAQDLHDLANWYGQVQDLNRSAGTNATHVANQVAQGIAGTGQDLMSALGGSANGAAGMMAAVTAQNAALQQQLGGIEATYRGDNSAALANDQAGAEAATSAQHSAQMNDLQLKLADLLGQRGQARRTALMDIIDKNNALAQQRFTNRQSKLESGVGALAAMGNIALTRAQIHAQRQQNQQQTNPGKHTPWATISPTDQWNMVKGWMEGGPNGSRVAKNVAIARARAQLYTAPAAMALINAAYQTK